MKIRHVTVRELINVPTYVQLIRLEKVDFSMRVYICFCVSNLLVTKASPTCIIQYEKCPPMFLCRHCLVVYQLCHTRLGHSGWCGDSMPFIIDFDLATYTIKKNSAMKVPCVIENAISFSTYFSIPSTVMPSPLTLITTLRSWVTRSFLDRFTLESKALQCGRLHSRSQLYSMAI